MNPSQSANVMAQDVATAVFEIVGDAVLAGDFDSFASMFALPINMVQGEQLIPIQTRKDLRMFFDTRHARLKQMGVTELVRVCVDAAQETPGRIFATHVGHFIKDGQSITDPQAVYTVFERQDGQWKIISNECAVWTGTVTNDEDI